MPSPAVFLPLLLFSVVFRSFPAIPRRPPPSPTVPYCPLPEMSQIVGFVVLPNDGPPVKFKNEG